MLTCLLTAGQHCSRNCFPIHFSPFFVAYVQFNHLKLQKQCSIPHRSFFLKSLVQVSLTYACIGDFAKYDIPPSTTTKATIEVWFLWKSYPDRGLEETSKEEAQASFFRAIREICAFMEKGWKT